MNWSPEQLERQIAGWRNSIREGPDGAPVTGDLESRLREEFATLEETDLAQEEAFLIAVKRVERLGRHPALSDKELSRLWRPEDPIVVDADRRPSRDRTEAATIFGLALAAAIAVKVPELFGHDLDGSEGFYARNLSFFVLPFLILYFIWKRRPGSRVLAWTAASFVAAAVLVNTFPFRPGGSTEGLTAIHLPIALWLVVGFTYVGGEWGARSARMAFVRFSGEMFIHFVLIALGGAVLTALTVFMFESAGLDVESFVGRWLLPCGAAGGVIVAAGLVESRRLTNMAPVLTRLFTPLFALVMVVFLFTLVLTGRGLNIERNILVGFDLLLVLVLCLILYAVSARDKSRKPGAFDVLQLILVVSALLVDFVALSAIASRISEFGFSPNKLAAAGLNLLLLVNLAWSAWLYLSFLRRRKPFSVLEEWQTAYLTVFAFWAAIVAVGFPVMFGFS